MTGRNIRRKYIKRLPATVGVCCIAVMVVLPLVYIPVGAFMDQAELSSLLRPLWEEGGGYVSWHMFPLYPAVTNLAKLLFFSPEFYRLFWNSVFLTGMVLMGQLLIGMPSAWAFSAFTFPGRKILFGIYTVLMLMPFQVMLLPQYLVIKETGLYDTPWAVILPLMFSAFPVFIMYRGFSGMDRNLMEAARLDGAGEQQVFFYIGIPSGKAGIEAAVVLEFLECWNLVEQPMSFLEKKSLWPLSLYLPETGAEQVGFAFAVALITLIPPLFVYALGQDALQDGIACMGISK